MRRYFLLVPPLALVCAESMLKRYCNTTLTAGLYATEQGQLICLPEDWLKAVSINVSVTA